MKILCFGIAKEIMGGSSIEINSEDISSVKDLKSHLLNAYPEFSKYNQFMIAVNQTYAEDGDHLATGDEIAIIPPVSGG